MKKLLVGICSIAFLLLTGCQTTARISMAKGFTTPKSYIKLDSSSNPELTFISYGSKTLKNAPAKIKWSPLVVPANEEVDIIVHAHFDESKKSKSKSQIIKVATKLTAGSRNVCTDVVFLCPKLEKGRTYTLSFVKKDGVPGKNVLRLTDNLRKKVVAEYEFASKYKESK